MSHPEAGNCPRARLRRDGGEGDVVYGLLAAQSGFPEAQTVFELVARALHVEAIAGLPEKDEPAQTDRR
jgi:hypothetical protein